jgi:hypothetical protein
VTANEDGYANIRKFAVAGLVMVTEDNRIHLLMNAILRLGINGGRIQGASRGFLARYGRLVGTPSPNFLLQTSLARKGLLE